MKKKKPVYLVIMFTPYNKYTVVLMCTFLIFSWNNELLINDNISSYDYKHYIKTVIIAKTLYKDQNINLSRLLDKR